jgi:hypothetical protein
VIKQKPDSDKAERGKTEPDQTTTNMRIISGATFRERERGRERERERKREREKEKQTNIWFFGKTSV